MWDDCQQLLQILFTTEERERIQLEARKLVPGDNGQPTANPATINSSFPLSRPQWDYNTAEGKERLGSTARSCWGGLKAAARRPTTLAKVGNVEQGREESPAAFLQRLMDAFRQYTPKDPEAEDTRSALMMHFINQSAPDIRKKLQKIDGLGEKSIQDLMAVAEKVYNNRETFEEKQTRATDRQTRNMARILLAATSAQPNEREKRLRQLAEGKPKPNPQGKPKLGRNQRAYCKQEGHWVKDCPKKFKQGTNVLAVGDLSD